MKRGHRLAIVLFVLAALYVLWFAHDRHALAAMLVFALPPALLGLTAWRGWSRAGLSAGLFALLWFSHGVMVAWTRAPERWFAFAEILLALAIIALASLPGLRARFSKSK
jgi:uncharacterized membrane protein